MYLQSYTQWANQRITIGIGRQTAIALSKAGWNVVLTARREKELLETSTLCSGPFHVVVGDVTDENFVAKLFGETLVIFGTSKAQMSTWHCHSTHTYFYISSL